MADEADSKSVVGNHVRVQVPLPAVDQQPEYSWYMDIRAVLEYFSAHKKEQRTHIPVAALFYFYNLCFL